MADRQPSFAELMRGRFPDAPRGTCRWCGERVESRDAARRRWHRQCREAMSIRLRWSAMRRHVVGRDGPACRACGLDGADAERELLRQSREAGYLTARGLSLVPLGRVLVDSGYDPSRSLWEVDHLVPLADGGSGEPEWLWVLCQVCHRRKTSHEASLRSGREWSNTRPKPDEAPGVHAEWWVRWLRGQAQPLAPADPGEAWRAG